MNINTLSQTTAEYESSKLVVALYPNAMRKAVDGKTTYHARAVFRNKLSMETIANDILATGSLSSYSAAQIVSVWSVVNNAVIDRVLNGAIVDGGIGSFYAKISGSFESEQSTFDSSKHTIDLGFRSSANVKELASSITPAIAQGNSVKPEIISVYDLESGTSDTLTPGGFFTVTGKSILVTGEKKDVGLYFVNKGDESKTVKVEPSKLGVNSSSKVACVIPRLESGEYQVKVVTQFMKSTIFSKAPKSHTFERSLTVK